MNLSSDAAHSFHVWINKRSDERTKAGEEREHSLYEFKDLISYLSYGDKRIGEAFEGKLRNTHTHCSMSPTETIEKNVLKCCLGKDVTECPILLSLKSTVEAEDHRRVKWYRDQIGKQKDPMPSSEVYKLMAITCGWHIYREATKNGEAWSGVDTSEGYHLDESDRRFWTRTYESLASGDPDELLAAQTGTSSPAKEESKHDQTVEGSTTCE